MGPRSVVTISQKPMQLIRLPTWHTNVLGWVVEPRLFWGQKVKGQGHKVNVGFQTTQYCRCCSMERKLRWAFPAVMPAAQTMLLRVCSLRHFTACACRWTLDFPRRGFLHSCGCRLLLMSLAYMHCVCQCTCKEKWKRLLTAPWYPAS